MSKLNTFLKYGVDLPLAERLVQAGLSVTSVRAMSNEVLSQSFGLTTEGTALLKKAVTREPIDDELVQRLLDEANYTCCVCRGVKSDAFLLHHIFPYAVSQDNSYENLAVLCPTCHDLAHRTPGLSTGLSAENIRRRKYDWIAAVQKVNSAAAASAGRMAEIDFVNVERIAIMAAERGIQLTPPAPATDMSPTSDAPGHFARLQYKLSLARIFLDLVPSLAPVDLETLWNEKAARAPETANLWTFYCGGLYGKSPGYPVTQDSPATRLLLRRKGMAAMWPLSPMNLMSSTACMRLGDHSIYLVYGRIRSVGEVKLAGKTHLQYDIRPYLFGSPEVRGPDKTPFVYFVKSYEPEEEMDTDENAELVALQSAQVAAEDDDP
jgi:hypothetical protein